MFHIFSPILIIYFQNNIWVKGAAALIKID